jgi:hypothetical protein
MCRFSNEDNAVEILRLDAHGITLRDLVELEHYENLKEACHFR